MLLVYARVRASEIHGMGLFAEQFIPAGTVVWHFTPGFDVEIPEWSMESLSPAAKKQVLHYAEYYPAERKFVLSSDDDRFTNHSDSANTARFDRNMDMVATRDIQEGEEITCSYHEVFMVGFRP